MRKEKDLRMYKIELKETRKELKETYEEIDILTKCLNDSRELARRLEEEKNKQAYKYSLSLEKLNLKCDILNERLLRLEKKE